MYPRKFVLLGMSEFDTQRLGSGQLMGLQGTLADTATVAWVIDTSPKIIIAAAKNSSRYFMLFVS